MIEKKLQSKAWLIAAIALGLALITSALWSYSHHKAQNAAREAEAARLALLGQIVAKDESIAGLRADLVSLLLKNSDLREAVAKAKAAAPGAQPESVVQLRTGSLDLARTAQQSVVTGPQARVQQPAKPPAPSRCLLTPADRVSVDVDIVSLRTREGNLLLAGATKVWKEGTSPDLFRSLLAEGPFQSSVSNVAALAPKDSPRWGAGALVACSLQSCGPGVMLMLPPQRFLGLQVEPWVGALSAPLAALGGVGVRW